MLVVLLRYSTVLSLRAYGWFLGQLWWKCWLPKGKNLLNSCGVPNIVLGWDIGNSCLVIGIVWIEMKVK